ncbi:MAG: hypothetical protein C4288_08720 [Leptolyngbya sp. ERB_1_1]
MEFLPWVATAGIAWSIGAWFNLFWFQDPAWVTSIYQQKIARAEQVKAPRRILLVGGSSTHFGLSAEELQEKFGIPVLNLGLHAGLGLDAIDKLVQDEIRPDDIVILFPEHDLLAMKENEELNILPTLVAFRSGHFSIIKDDQEGPEQLVNRLLLVGSPQFFHVVNAVKSALVGGKKPTWYNFNVGANGDSLDSLSGGKPPFHPIEVSLSNDALERIRQFRSQVQQRHASLIIGIPWKLAMTNPQTQQELQQVIQSLSQVAPVLYDPKSLNLKQDASLFGDTSFHLTPKGRAMRTHELARQLQPLLQKVSAKRQ